MESEMLCSYNSAWWALYHALGDRYVVISLSYCVSLYASVSATLTYQHH